MEEILLRFPIEGKALSAEPLSAGHINRSFLITTDAGRRYVLQRVNPFVFRDAAAIMENIRLIRDFLRDGPERPPMIAFLDTLDGRAYAEDAQGAAWRLCPYVENSLSLAGSLSLNRFVVNGFAQRAVAVLL